MNENNRSYPNFESLFNRKPRAVARVRGREQHPNIEGEVWFYQTNYGVLVVADIEGLPNPTETCKSPVFAFHIHQGKSCTGDNQDPFADAGAHYNPNECQHPYHAGDLPPLFGANGYAFSVVLSNRFKLNEVIGRTIIIHSNPDDFTTQPSGNSGGRIACGIIESI